ncbi:MAG: VWA domain-containing protein [Gammaproteobacteria bacterium]
MRFAAWAYFPLLCLVPALLVLYGYAFVRKRQALNAFADLALAPKLLPGYSRRRQWDKALCLIGAAGCLALALLQPQWGSSPLDMPRRGRDLIIALDVSLSMLAEDARPNRLQRSKAAIADLVEVIRQEGGHRLGLAAFAGRASLLCPLTLDYPFFLKRLAELGTNSVAREGTLIGDALQQILQDFGTLEPGYTDIILISDGEDHGSFPQEAAQAAALQQASRSISRAERSAGRRVDPAGETRACAGQRLKAQPASDLRRQSLLLNW